jgi:predicted AlkP superfamily pyrophosphatase or phosphodiesterase
MNFWQNGRSMRAWVLALVFSISLAQSSAQAQTRTTQGPEPKLVVAIVIDQFRYDYLTRFRSEYTGGLKEMLEQGADFTNARYRVSPTVTAVGHSIILSGATPAVSGIIGNAWWDRTSGAMVTSVSDTRTRLVGANGPGSSPRRMLSSTIGDELKESGKGGKVIGISFKDRSAILPGGHTADAAYWFDNGTGTFVSSTYYFKSLPTWVTDFNKSHPADKYAGQEWMKHKMPEAAGRDLYDALEPTPYSNELIEQMALRALAAEKLGTGGKTDVLTVSYSGNDYVGHRYGPDSAEVHDAALRVDKLVGELLQAAEAHAGAGNVLAVLTADHGVAPLPEENRKRKMPGGRLDEEQMQAAVEAALEAKYGGSHWVASVSEAGVYLNIPAGIGTAQAEGTAALALRLYPHVARVYTHTQMVSGETQSDTIGTAMQNGFNAARSGDVLFVLEPYWIFGAGGTTHGTPYDYDTHVPILFWGPRVRAGRYHANVAPNDIAPTLATLLDIETPSGSTGRVLTEMLK